MAIISWTFYSILSSKYFSCESEWAHTHRLGLGYVRRRWLKMGIQPEICQMVIIYQNNIVSLTFSIYLYAYTGDHIPYGFAVFLSPSRFRLSVQKDHFDWCNNVSGFWTVFLCLYGLRTKNVHANHGSDMFLSAKATTTAANAMNSVFIYRDGWSGSSFAIAQKKIIQSYQFSVATLEPDQQLQFKNK